MKTRLLLPTVAPLARIVPDLAPASVAEPKVYPLHSADTQPPGTPSATIDHDC